MTNGEKHIEKLLSWYKEAVTEDGVCYLTSDDKNTLAYALKCCKHFEDLKNDIDTWMLRNNPSSSEKPNKSEIPTSSTTKNDLGVDCISRDSAIKALDYDIKCFEFKSGVSKHMDDIAKLLNTIYETQENNIKALPSVTPQEPIRPKGKWIPYHYGAYYECSNCHGRNNSRYDKYCKFCGAEMEEVEE